MLYLLSRGRGSQSPQIETVILHFTDKILGDRKITYNIASVLLSITCFSSLKIFKKCLFKLPSSVKTD